MVRVAGEVTGSPLSLLPCVVGLSGPLFALKVLVILRSDRSDLPPYSINFLKVLSREMDLVEIRLIR
jgi:hypothetical protein